MRSLSLSVHVFIELQFYKVIPNMEISKFFDLQCTISSATALFQPHAFLWRRYAFDGGEFEVTGQLSLASERLT